MYILLLGLVLNVIEFVLFILICMLGSIFHVFSNTDLYSDFESSSNLLGIIIKDFDVAFTVALFRVIIYSGVWLFIFMFFYESETEKYCPLKLAIFNCLIYICSSVLICIVMNDFWDWFLSIIFFGFVFTTLVSPFILAKIPVLKNLINLRLREESQD